MSRPADHHVPRPRLTARLRGAAVAVVWAGAGCGKSSLAAEIRGELDTAPVEARLGAGDGPPDRLVDRLGRALRRAGQTDGLAAMNREHDNPAAALEALADWLAAQPQPMHLVVDDCHHADEDSCRLLARLADELPAQHRLLILVRGPAPALAPLARLTQAIWLDTADLAFTADEVASLALGRAQFVLHPTDAEALRRATGGWVAAVVLAIRRLAETADPAHELRELVEQPSLHAHLVSELFGSLDEDAIPGVVQLAHLPLLSIELGRLASGGRIPDLLGQATAAGLPLSRVHEGWWKLAEGVQEYIAGLDPLRPEVAEAAAGAYLRGGETRAALTVLLRPGLAEQAAALVAGLSPDRLDRLDYAELGAIIDALPPAAIGLHPRVLIHFARACEAGAQVQARAAALQRARSVAGEGPGPLRRELDVEIGRDLAADNKPEEAEALVEAALAGATAEELATRARALDVLGRVAALRGDDKSLQQAESLLEEALVLCRALGQDSWAGQVSMALVDRVHFAQGQYQLAVQRIDELLRGLPGPGRTRAVVLTFRACILVDCGRFAEGESTLGEARRLIEMTGDRRAAGYVAWDSARLASQRDDPAATVAALREAEAHRSDWFEHSTGAEFLAEAADLLDRVGETDLARDYLTRASERAAEAELDYTTAVAATLARGGDPAAARETLARLAQMPRLQRRERWRVTLLTAWAALRGDDPDAGILAGQAFDEAAALGIPELPLLRERRVAERLLPLAVSAGSASAASLAAERPPLEIALLGEFNVSRAGRVLPMPNGKPSALVKLVAASGGRVTADDAIEALWPDSTRESGRRGLRNALNRLRRTAGDVLVREGESLCLPLGAHVDATIFEAEARHALAEDSDVELAQRALACYRGELLVDERYESWAAGPRERSRDLYLRLLDLLTDQVEADGDLGEALRLLERAIEADPYEDRRYLIAARIMAAQGRYGSAAQTLSRGAEAIRSLGLPEPAAFGKLAETIDARSPGLIDDRLRLNARPGGGNGASA